MNSQDTMHRLRAARQVAGRPSQNDDLFARIVAEPGDPDFGQSTGRHSRLVVLKRPRLLASGSLGIAGLAAAVTLIFGGGAAAPAFAVTREADGTVLVNLSSPRAIVAADKQLVTMGINEQVNYQTAPGAATSSAPVDCKLVKGPGDYTAAPKSAGPPVEMRLGGDNTGTGDANTGSPGGTVHLASCVSYPEGPGTQVGNSGQKFLQAHGG